MHTRMSHSLRILIAVSMSLTAWSADAYGQHRRSPRPVMMPHMPVMMPHMPHTPVMTPHMPVMTPHMPVMTLHTLRTNVPTAHVPTTRRTTGSFLGAGQRTPTLASELRQLGLNAAYSPLLQAYLGTGLGYGGYGLLGGYGAGGYGNGGYGLTGGYGGGGYGGGGNGASGGAGAGYGGGYGAGGGNGGGNSLGAGGYGGGSGYGAGGQASNPYPYQTPASPTYPAPSATDSALDILGVPTENGRVSWPLGLRVLPPAVKTAALRRQIESVLRLDQGQMPAGAVDVATAATDQLRKLLRKQRDRGVLAERTISDAADFLDRLESALTALRR